MFGASVPVNIAILPGEQFKVLASSATLRRHLTDAYWCHNMEMVCDGKLAGEVVRLTGKDLVMMKFPCAKLSPSGKQYEYAFSIPSQYLVPVSMRRAMGTSLLPLGASVNFASSVPVHDMLSGASPLMSSTLGESAFASPAAGAEPFIPHLCVVCGRWDLPGEVRRHGYKCNGCIGTKSLPRLRTESFRLKAEVETPPTEIES